MKDMREALCKIVRICDGEDTGWLNERVAIYNIAKAALARPARNCDRFNSGDSIKDGNDACDAWYDEPDAMRQHFSHWILSEVANGRGGDDGSK